ncbi:MAG: glycosyltransferase family 2 protein [Candidatus Aureabacteria bacterium]|nr:glycosyltransferase family 2 protein [Candidatus Auribacterota bacterium]
MKLSLVIPVYNEAKTLQTVYQRITDVPFSLEYEMVFVDDGSSDASPEILRKLAEKDPRIRLILKEKNGGKGSALVKGFEEARGDIIVVQDADMEYDPAEIPSLIHPIVKNKADIVYGSRYSSMSTQVVKFYHYLGNRVLTLFSNMMSDIRLTDMETCYKCFRSEIIKNIRITSMRFGFEPEVTAKIAKLNCRIHELPISYVQRSYAEGKKIGFKDGLEALWCIFKFNLLTSAESSFKETMPEKYYKKK